MPAEIITRAALIEYGSRSGVMIETFSAEQLDDVLVRTTDRIRQAMLNEYTPESFEALTPETVPAEMRDYALPLALGLLTKGDAGRPDSVGDEFDAASRWLGFVVAGRTHYDRSPNAVLVKNGGDGVSYKVPDTKKFRDPWAGMGRKR